MNSSKELQIRNSFIYLIPVGVGNLIPLITLPIFTRILTKEDYGVFALSQIYAIFVSGIANFGLTIGYERNFFEYRDRHKAAQLLYSTLAFILTAFAVFGLLTYIFKAPLAKWIIGSREHADLLFWTFCSTGIMGLKTYYLSYFKNTEDAKSLVWYTIDESLLGVVFSMFFVVLLRVGVIGLAWGQLFASVAVFSVLALRFRKILPVAFDVRLLKESLRLSVPLTPRIFLGVINNQFDKYMIGLLATVGGVGIYSIGQKVANVVFTYMTAIQNVFSPQVYKRMFDLGEKGGESVGRYLTPFAYVSVFIGLLVSLFSEEIVFVLTPPSYYRAADVVTILSMMYASYFFAKQPQLIYVKKTFMTSLLTLASLVLNVVINIPLIKMWGMIGAAWGTLFAGLLTGVLAFVISQHYYRIVWEARRLVQIFGIFFGASLSIVLVRYLGVGYAARLGIKAFWLALFISLGVRMRTISRENLASVIRLIRSKGRVLPAGGRASS
jgi:O-antigen/teichoic acid export membrane protein